MKRFAKIFTVTTALVLFLVFAGCSGQGERMFSGTSWEGTWKNGNEEAIVKMIFEHDLTGTLTITYDGKSQSFDFNWDAWVNRNNNNIPYSNYYYVEDYSNGSEFYNFDAPFTDMINQLEMDTDNNCVYFYEDEVLYIFGMEVLGFEESSYWGANRPDWYPKLYKK